MKLSVLGKYGRYAPKFGATSGYLLQIENHIYFDEINTKSPTENIENACRNIVIDLGSGCLARLQEYIKLEEIDLIILSHLHYDHISDVFTLRYALEYLKNQGKLQRKIKLLLPQTPCNIFEELNSYPCFDCEVIKEGVLKNFALAQISFYEMSHSVKCFGVRISANKKILSYIADTRLCQNISSLTASADAVIGDAMQCEDEWSEGSPHLTVAELAKACKGKRLMLSHLPHTGEKKILKEAREHNITSEIIEEKTYQI